MVFYRGDFSVEALFDYGVDKPFACLIQNKLFTGLGIRAIIHKSYKYCFQYIQGMGSANQK